MKGKKANDFGVESNEPHGPTFDGNSYPSMAGSSNTKRKARFGVTDNEPGGATFCHAGSHVKFPSREPAPKGSKVVKSSKSDGFKPSPGAPQNFPGSIAVGKSAPK